MNIFYNIVISNTEPTKPQPGWYWLKPATSQLYLFVRTKWVLICGGGTVTVGWVDGIYWKEIHSGATPPADELGKKWYDSVKKQENVFISTWHPLMG